MRWANCAANILNAFRPLRLHCVMTDVEGSVAEARRAIRDLGARGVLLYTNVAGSPLDDPQFEPIFATMAELDLPIWLHPVGTAAMPDYPAEKKIAL